MFKNKKGFVVEFLADIYVFILFMLLMLIFTLLFYFGAKTVKAEIKGEYENLDGNTILLNYLRTPVEIDGKNINIAELILISEFDKEKRNRLKTITRDLLIKFNTFSYKDDYSIKIEFSDEPLFIGQVGGFLIGKIEQKEVGKIKLPSLEGDISISIFNYKGDIEFSDFVLEATKGDIVTTIDGISYVYWGNDFFEQWIEKGGAWSQEGWPCDAEIKDEKIVCKNEYKPTPEDMPCFIPGKSFTEGLKPPFEPKNCFKKDKEGKVISKSYYDEVIAKEIKEEIKEECIKADSLTFSNTVINAKIGDCVIAPDGTKWINWGYSSIVNERLWSKEYICDKTISKKNFLACEKYSIEKHPADFIGPSKFKVQKDLLEMY